MTSHDLLRKWSRERDELAFRELVHRHAPMVFATSKRILRDDAEAQDVTQECFETLATTRRLPDSNLGPWLHRVATNRCLDRLRTTGRRAKREIDFATRQLQPHATGWNDIYDLVDEAIAELPGKYRTVIIAHFLEGRPQADIANELHLTRQAVHERINRGIEAVRAALKHRGIQIPAATLTALLANHASAAAVPLALTTSLGKLALSTRAFARGSMLFGLSDNIGTWLAGMAAITLVVVAGLVVRSNNLPNPPETAAMVRDIAAVADTPVAPMNDLEQSDTTSAGVPTSRWPLGPSTMPEPMVVRPASETVDDTPRRASISGVVVRADGNPLAHAQIVIEELTGKSQAGTHGNRWTGTADGNGSFHIKGLKGSDYSVQVTPQDVSIGGFNFEITQVHVDPDQQLTGLRLVYGSEGKLRIAGTVMNARGEAIPKATVVAYGTAVTRATVTDTLGRFLLEFLPDGEYLVVAEPKNKSPQLYARANVNANAGDRYVKLLLPRTGGVSGRIVQTDSQIPIQNFQINNRTFSDPDGAFLLEGVPPGTQTVKATAENYSAVSLEVLVTEGKVVSDVIIALPPERSLSGKVVDSEGRPVAYARIYEGRPESNNAREDDVPIVVTNNTGSFTVRDVPNRYRGLSANCEGYAAGFALASEGMTIVMHRPATVIATVTENGNPFSTATVEVLSISGQYNVFQDYARVDMNGRAILENIPPGIAHITAYHPSDANQRGVLQRVRLDPGSEARLAFEFSPITAGLEGVVVWHGAPAVSVIVFLQVRTANGIESYQTRTKEAGQFWFDELPEGSATLKVWVTDEGHSVRRGIQLTAGEVLRETFTFSGSNTVEGRFIGFDGSEIGSVAVLVGRHAPESFTETINFGATVPFEHVDSAVCDDRGHFRIDDLDPGEYTVVAQSGTLGDWGSLRVFASTYITITDGVVARADFEYK